MLDKALQFISNQLNRNLKFTFGLSADIVAPGSLINLDGSVTNNIENKIIISIINLEQEKVIKNNETYLPMGNGQYGKVNPSVYLNLYLLVSANYNADNYLEALKMLSSVIGFFQSSAVFTPAKYPSLDPSIHRLTFEIYNIPVHELSHVWSGIGAKYVPSIVYKVRMICINDTEIKEEITAINDVTGLTNKK